MEKKKLELNEVGLDSSTQFIIKKILNSDIEIYKNTPIYSLLSTRKKYVKDLVHIKFGTEIEAQKYMDGLVALQRDIGKVLSILI